MVRGDHRQRFTRAEPGVPAVDEAPHQGVDEFDLTGICLREGFGAVVGCVRVDEVDPQELRPAGIDPVEPRFDAGDRPVAAVLVSPGTSLAVGRLKAEDLLLLEPAPAGDGRRRVPDIGGELGQRPASARTVDAVPVDAVHRRHAAGHQAGVRGQRRGQGGQVLAEAYAGASESVEARRADVALTVAAEVIAAQRVDGDQQDVPVHGEAPMRYPAPGRELAVAVARGGGTGRVLRPPPPATWSTTACLAATSTVSSPSRRAPPPDSG